MNIPLIEPPQKSKCKKTNRKKSKRSKTITGVASKTGRTVSKHNDNPIAKSKSEHKVWSPIDLKEFQDQTNILYETTISMGNETNEEYKRIDGELRECEILNKDKESYKQKDLILMEKVCLYLVELKSEAKTFSLKKKCEEALSLFDVSEEIAVEMHGLDNHIKSLKEKLVKLGNKLEGYKNQAGRLEDIDHTIKEYELDGRTLPESISSKEENILSLAHHNINTTIYKYRACNFTEILFDIEEVERQKLVNIGQGVKVSKPVTVGRELRNVGYNFHASISHNGVVAIYSFNGTMVEYQAHKYTPGDKKCIIQFTDLLSTRQVEMELEQLSLVAFYDNSMILLTFDQQLREVPVESVFDNPTLRVFKRVGSVGKATLYADVSLLHMTRVLYYRDIYFVPYEYNVDTHTTKIDTKYTALSFASMTGIDVGVKGMFKEYQGDGSIFTLNNDNTTTKIRGKQLGSLRNFLPSSTCPSDIEKGMFKYVDYFIFNNKKITPTTPIRFESFQSLVRVYRDIFLTYDMNTHQWVLVKIIVP